VKSLVAKETGFGRRAQVGVAIQDGSGKRMAVRVGLAEARAFHLELTQAIANIEDNCAKFDNRMQFMTEGEPNGSD
jgi:hypothetical protein